MSDRIVVMNDGKVMQVGTPVEIYSRPANLFVADFIGKVNLFEGGAVEQGDGGYRVAYSGGEKQVTSNAGSLSSGQAVRTVVRLESLLLARAGQAGGGFFRGRIGKVVYLGPTVEYEVQVEGQQRPVNAVVAHPIEAGFFQEGEAVTLDFHPGAAHLVRSRGFEGSAMEEYFGPISRLYED